MTSRPARVLSVVLVTAMLMSLVAPGYAADKKINGPIQVSSFTDASGSININVGKGEGISVGTKGVIIRDGKQIAEYKVVQVHWGFSSIDVSNVTEGFTVQAGDSAPIASTADGSTSSKKKRKLKLIWTVLGVAAIAVLLGGHRGGGSSSSGNGKISITTQKTTNPDGSGTVTITAKIVDQNQNPAPDGTSVTFSSTAGTLNRTEVKTTAGNAIVTLSYDDSVTAEEAIVTVKALGATATTDPISFISSIHLQASPTSIQIRGSGGSVTEATITATCRDAFGVPVSSGDITFSASLGTIDPKVAIGSNGIATAEFYSTTSGRATITATWSKSKATIDVEITAGPPYSLTVNSSTSSIPCDGNSSATITATVKDVGDNLAANGTVVNFTVIADGSGGGNGSITTPASTINGVATTHLYSRDSTGSPSIPGEAKVKAEVKANQPTGVPLPVSDLVNENTKIQFISIDVGSILLSAYPSNVNYSIDKTTTITAVVKNADNQPISGSMQVHFTATHGVFTDSGISTTSNGIATITLKPDASGTPSWNGLVDVTATAGDVTVTSNGLVIFSGPASGTYSDATISPNTIAKTNGECTITVIARDANDHPVADGTTIACTKDKVRMTVTPASATTSGGRVTFTLKSSEDDANPTPLGNGSVTVTVGTSSPWTKTLTFTVID